MGQYLAHPKESDHPVRCPWEGHTDSINNRDGSSNNNVIFIVHIQSARTVLGAFFFSFLYFVF